MRKFIADRYQSRAHALLHRQAVRSRSRVQTSRKLPNLHAVRSYGCREIRGNAERPKDHQAMAEEQERPR
jgi:hypothetical protein